MKPTNVPATVFAIGLLAVVASCNTVAGAGKDLEQAGDAITDTAKDVEADLKKDDEKKNDSNTSGAQTTTPPQ